MQFNGGKVNVGLLKSFGLDRFARVCCRFCREEVAYDIDSDFNDERVYARFREDILLAVDPAPAKGLRRLANKTKRFFSRRWTYPLVGEHFVLATIRTVWEHVMDPVSWFSGRG